MLPSQCCLLTHDMPLLLKQDRRSNVMIYVMHLPYAIHAFEGRRLACLSVAVDQ